jgi:hypothetical protein
MRKRKIRTRIKIKIEKGVQKEQRYKEDWNRNASRKEAGKRET